MEPLNPESLCGPYKTGLHSTLLRPRRWTWNSLDLGPDHHPFLSETISSLKFSYFNFTEPGGGRETPIKGSLRRATMSKQTLPSGF